MEKHTCLFCGDTRMVVYKQISTVEILDIVDRQIKAGIADPAIIFLRNFTECLRLQPIGSSHVPRAKEVHGHANAATLACSSSATESRFLKYPAIPRASFDSSVSTHVVDDMHNANLDADQGEGDSFSQASVEDLSDDSDCEEEEEVPVQCCICCFHWITRRKKLSITVIPMQCLLYFVTGINTVESKQCDTRVLTRLATTVAEEKNNVWRSIFRGHELEAIEFIVSRRKKTVAGGDPCCIKRELAYFYHAQNGSSMLLGRRSVADMLRMPATCKI